MKNPVDRPTLLMFAPQCYPPAGAEAIVTAKLILAMKGAGWEVDVIGQAGAGQFYPSDPAGIWAPLKDVVHNIEVGRCSAGGRGGHGPHRPFLARAESFKWATRAISAARRLALRKKYDFVLSRVAPQYGHIPALAFSKLSGIPWIANWSDPMPAKKGPAPYGKGPDATLSFPMRGYLGAVSRVAAWHTFPNERLRRYMCTYLPGIEEKSSVIPHVALESLAGKPVAAASVFSLCHIGGLGLRKPDVFLEGVRLFLVRTKVNQPISVRFVGLGLDEIAGKVAMLGLQDVVTCVGARTYEEAQEIAAASTVLVVIEAPCAEGIFLPSKFVDFVQTGRPILAVSPQVGVLTDILANGGGIAAGCDSPCGVAEAVGKLYGAWQAGRLDALYGSSRLMELYSERHVLKLYGDLFCRLGTCVEA